MEKFVGSEKKWRNLWGVKEKGGKIRENVGKMKEIRKMLEK
jgi:hypothetical protein